MIFSLRFVYLYFGLIRTQTQRRVQCKFRYAFVHFARQQRKYPLFSNFQILFIIHLAQIRLEVFCVRLRVLDSLR